MPHVIIDQYPPIGLLSFEGTKGAERYTKGESLGAKMRSKCCMHGLAQWCYPVERQVRAAPQRTPTNVRMDPRARSPETQNAWSGRFPGSIQSRCARSQSGAMLA